MDWHAVQLCRLTGCVIPQCDYIWSTSAGGDSGGTHKVLVVGLSRRRLSVEMNRCLCVILVYLPPSDLPLVPLYVPVEDSVECKPITAQLDTECFHNVTYSCCSDSQKKMTADRIRVGLN